MFQVAALFLFVVSARRGGLYVPQRQIWACENVAACHNYFPTSGQLVRLDKLPLHLSRKKA